MQNQSGAIALMRTSGIRWTGSSSLDKLQANVTPSPLFDQLMQFRHLSMQGINGNGQMRMVRI